MKPLKVNLNLRHDLWQPHPYERGAFVPVDGKEAEAREWLAVEQDKCARANADRETAAAARKAALADKRANGLAAQLRAMQVGEVRGFSRYKHASQVTSTISYVSAVEDRSFTSGRDLMLDCIAIKRTR